MVFELCQEFVEVELPMISTLVFSQVYKETAKISTQNVIQYLMLCNWAIKMTRSKFLYEKSQVPIILFRKRMKYKLLKSNLISPKSLTSCKSPTFNSSTKFFSEKPLEKRKNSSRSTISTLVSNFSKATSMSFRTFLTASGPMTETTPMC
jgi:hypothetical protein